MSDSDKWFDVSGTSCMLLPTGSVLNFNVPLGTTGYGIEDASGTIKIKHRGGSWIEAVLLTRTGTNLAPAHTGDALIGLGQLAVTGTISATGPITSIGAVSGASVAATAAVTGASVTATGAVQGASGVVAGANGQAFTLAQVSQLVSTVAGTTVNTTIQVPAQALILGVTAKVTATLSATATNGVLTGATSGQTFTNTIAVANGTSVKATDSCPYISGAAELLTLTTDDVCETTGRIRVVINYISLTAPTS